MVDITVPEPSIELAEETGIHIGDGSMGFYKNGGIYSLAGHPKDDKKHYEEFIVPLINKLYSTKPKLRHWSGAYGFQICSKKLVEFKSKIGLPIGPKKNIGIPNWILKNKEFSNACTRGVFDTDGTFYLENKNNKLYPRIQIRSISKKLIYNLKSILKTKYKISVWEEKSKNKNWKDNFVIALRGKETKKWMKNIGSNNPKHVSKYNFL